MALYTWVDCMQKIESRDGGVSGTSKPDSHIVIHLLLALFFLRADMLGKMLRSLASRHMYVLIILCPPLIHNVIVWCCPLRRISPLIWNSN